VFCAKVPQVPVLLQLYSFFPHLNNTPVLASKMDIFTFSHIIIESRQCRRRPINPLSLHRSSDIVSYPDPLPTLSPYPHTFTMANPSNLHVLGHYGEMANSINLHISGLWEETRAPGQNPHRHGGKLLDCHKNPRGTLMSVMEGNLAPGLHKTLGTVSGDREK